jgi:hypothetical protein
MPYSVTYLPDLQDDRHMLVGDLGDLGDLGDAVSAHIDRRAACGWRLVAELGLGDRSGDHACSGGSVDPMLIFYRP